jgi:hypothetical protein
MPDEKELDKLAKQPAEGEEEEKDVGELMDIDFDLGNEFKDQLIPLALEYYMEVIEEDEGDEDSCGEDHDHSHHHGAAGGDSDDEDDQPK